VVGWHYFYYFSSETRNKSTSEGPLLLKEISLWRGMEGVNDRTQFSYMKAEFLHNYVIVRRSTRLQMEGSSLG
jgi:hypothetical protein